jgi:hypothetical protein
MKKLSSKFILIILLVLIVPLVGCVYEPLETDLNTLNIYPTVTDTYDIGSPLLEYDGGYFNELYLGGVLLVPGVAVETDPVFTASDSFPITAADIAAWDGHPPLTTGVHGVGAGTVVGTTLAQELTNKTITSAVGKGTWTADGVWKLPAMFFNGDITTDRWTSLEGNTFFGTRVASAGDLNGDHNTFVGHHTGYAITDGNYNCAWGSHALFYIEDGSSNVGVGYQTGGNIVDGSYNVMIGGGSGPTVDGSYGLYIDTTETDTPLIYGEFNTDEVHLYAAVDVGLDNTNYTSFADDGTMTMVGDARVVNAVWIDAGGIKSPGAKPATEIAHGTLETPAWQFDNEALVANQESVSFIMRISERMDRTVAPVIGIGWSSDTTDPGDDSVQAKWQLEYVWRSANEDTTAGAEGTVPQTVSASTTANGLVETLFTLSAPSATDICVHCKLKRLSADAADTIADTIELHGACFSWTSNKLGS